MELYDDKSSVKDRILDDLGKSIKLVQRYALCGYEGVVVIGNDSWLAQSLCHLLDLVLCHGLRDVHRGYWPIVREYSHSDTVRIIQTLKRISTSLGKGRAWLYYTLTEGSLQSYVLCLSRDAKTLHRHYTAVALIRDTPRTQQLLTLLAGLEQVQFNLDPDVAYLDMAAYQHQHSEVSSDLLPPCGDPTNLGPRMTSSITSSLASPVDSGVALLDSDADATSVSEATIEADNLSLRDDKEDDSSFNEIEDNRINHQLQTLETTVTKKAAAAAAQVECCNSLTKAVEDSAQQPVAFSVMTASDIANQNVSEEDLLAAASFVESRNRVNSELSGEDIVYRRQRSKKKRNSAAEAATKVKRVSFHEDFITNEGKCQTEFSVSFLPPDSVIKRDAVKGRYSWCGEGDAPFIRRRNNESDTKSDVYLSSSSDETLCMEDPLARTKPPVRYPLGEVTQTPPVAERGIPEGQEDPPNSASILCLHTDTSRKQGIGGNLPEAIRRLGGNLKKFPSFASFEWSSDSESIPASDTEFICSRTGHLISSSFKENCFMENFAGSSSSLDVRTVKNRSQHRSVRKNKPLSILPSRDVASKTSLLNRFMRSLTQKKFVQKKPKIVLKSSQSLYIPRVRNIDHNEVLQHFKLELDAEMRLRDSSEPECALATELQENLRTQAFQDAHEMLYKVFKVSSSYCSDGIGKPLLAILTDVNLYLTGVKSNYTYCNHLVLPYTELDAMLVGPSAQTVLFVSVDRRTQFLVVTGSRAITEQLVGHVEVAMRRAPSKPVLPAVRVLELDDMKALAQGLAQQIMMLEDEALCHYAMVHFQDDHVSPPSTPMGPTREGHLMFRPATDAPLQPWEPGFFMLKAGVVYMFGDKSQRLPKRVIPLRGNGCRGCRRIPYAQRPHTFEILLGPRRSFQFAAADEYEASDWLQAFVQAASGVYEEERVATVPCSLVLTERHLVTCKEQPLRVLACAAIQDLTAFTAGRSWCVLEFACREVHESSGDWVLYFASFDELQSFQDVLHQLWLSLQQ
ncbi:pleckstrin homology domain-containing family M member 2 isoform X2 [Periplaneta americana]